MPLSSAYPLFFFNDTATTEIYTLSLHDALPISLLTITNGYLRMDGLPSNQKFVIDTEERDRKSTRLNSSHGYISYAVFCLKKKKNKSRNTHQARMST